MSRTLLFASLLALASCGTTSVQVEPVSCTLIANPDVDVVAPGDTLGLQGGPFSSVPDTVVRIGGVDADVLDVVRDDCAVCDVCRSDNDCGACGDCEACDDACSACVERVTVTVPAVAPGVRSLLLVNLYGTSAPAALTVLGPPDDTDAPVDSDTDPASDSDTDAP